MWPFKRTRTLSLQSHLLLLAVFAVGMVFLWMLPALLVGFPYRLPGLLLQLQNFSETGIYDPTGPRLPVLLLAPLQSIIAPDNINGWVSLSAAAFALALFPWWWSVRKLFDTSVAWFSTIVLALLPILWVEALDLGGYTFAYFFLFLGFALFLEFFPQRKILAALLFGICFGLTLASKDALLTFLPWFIVGYLWSQKKRWKSSIIEVAVFCICVYGAYVAPLYPMAHQPNMTMSERLGVFLPSFVSSTPGEGHLYPDPYMFEHYQDEYNEVIQARVADGSLLERLENEHYRLIFGVGEFGFIDGIWNGIWLFLNTIPQLFIQEYTGGALLWVFVIPGAVVVYRKNRKLFWMMIGLWLSTEFLLRFVLHFGRTHLNDFGWEIALFAGVGMSLLTTVFSDLWKTKRTLIVASFIAVITALQLVQSDRKILAFHYSRSTVPESFAAGEAINALPATAVIAHPRRDDLFFFTDRTHQSLHPETIDFLAERGELAKPFRDLSITHIIAYDAEHAAKIKQAVPSIQIVTPDTESGVPVSPLVHYLLHVIR